MSIQSRTHSYRSVSSSRNGIAGRGLLSEDSGSSLEGGSTSRRVLASGFGEDERAGDSGLETLRERCRRAACDRNLRTRAGVLDR